MYYYYIISLSKKHEDMNNKCCNEAVWDNGIPLKVTNQTDPSVINWDINSLLRALTHNNDPLSQTHCDCKILVNCSLKRGLPSNKAIVFFVFFIFL